MPDGMNLLSAGIYTVSEASELIGVSQRRVRGWIVGYAGVKRNPLLQNGLGEYGKIDGRLAFSFANMMEMKFIKFFEDEKLPRAYIRSIFGQAQECLRHPHPFATRQVFRTDGMKIIEEVISKSGSALYDLKSKNFEMLSVVYSTLKEDVVYDAQGEARAWYPRFHAAPNVIVNPNFAFGRPCLRDSRVPTKAIVDAVKSEGGPTSVASWYEIPVRQVREAMKFEAMLRKAA